MCLAVGHMGSPEILEGLNEDDTGSASISLTGFVLFPGAQRQGTRGNMIFQPESASLESTDNFFCGL